MVVRMLKQTTHPSKHFATPVVPNPASAQERTELETGAIRIEPLISLCFAVLYQGVLGTQFSRA
eukprot:15276083-Heterocapsa_arctica.AAC.1